MILFLALVVLSVLLALVQVRRAPVGDPRVIRALLVRGAAAYLITWLLQRGAQVLAPGSAGPALVVDGFRLLAVLSSLLLWVSLARLAFYRPERRDLIWIVPFGILSILVAAQPSIPVTEAALLALPALVRVRWKREVGSGSLGLASVVGLLFVLLNFVQLSRNAEPSVGSAALAAFDKYSRYVQALTVIHLLAVLPRLLWGLNLQIRSVRRRLVVSHLLTGVVPMVLVLVFWVLSTYLSVNSERAQIGVNLLAEDAKELGTDLEAALRHPEGPDAGLGEWGGWEALRGRGLRLWESGPAGLSRVLGDSVPGEAALAEWPDSLPQEGLVLLGGRVYLGAARSAPSSDPAPRLRGLVLLPASAVFGPDLKRRLDADAFLETRFLIGGRGQALSGSESERIGGGIDAMPARTPGGSVGAAIVKALSWSSGRWETRNMLLWARVGFGQAVRGVASNIRKNPFNLVPLVFLGGVALLFVLVEILTLGMVTTMGRSILRALTALRQGTSRLRSGNLRYRIPVEGNDELWEVAESFNDMVADLEQAREMEIEKERLEGELSLARQIQARLLPGEAPVVSRLDLAGLSVPARHVGGDYYDFLLLPDGRVGLIVADVSGKGIPAALLMSSFRASLLSQDLSVAGPAAVFSRLNAFLHRSIETGRFVTAFFAVLDPATGRLLYVNGGHNPPYVLCQDGRISLLKEGGLILGLFPDSAYEEGEVNLSEGDLLVLYTDGVTEAGNEEDEFWGEDRLVSLLQRRASASCRALSREILSEVRDFSGDAGISDDITLLLARWRGPAPRA